MLKPERIMQPNWSLRVLNNTILKRFLHLNIFGYKESDECVPNPCQNGGNCIPKEDGNFKCDCPPGFTGDICEISKHNLLINIEFADEYK